MQILKRLLTVALAIAGGNAATLKLRAKHALPPGNIAGALLASSDVRSGMDSFAYSQFAGNVALGSHVHPIKQECVRKIKEKCRFSVSQHPNNKVDLVIPWVHYKGDESLKFELRSLEKFGVFDFVNNVFILADSEDVKNIDRQRINNTKFHILIARDVMGADSWCDWQHPQSDFSHVHTGWCKLSKLHLIPGISPWVIAMPDDDVLVNSFSWKLLYNEQNNLPYGYSHGELGAGQCLGDHPTAPLHGPTLLNTCAMTQVAHVLTEKYYLPHANGVWLNVDMMDDVCITQRALQHAGMLAGFFSYGDSPVSGRHFFQDCHTNYECRSPPLDAMFVNIQGDGVSPEYPMNNKTDKVFTDWFNRTYPEPSRFESEVDILMEEGFTKSTNFDYQHDGPSTRGSSRKDASVNTRNPMDWVFR